MERASSPTSSSCPAGLIKMSRSRLAGRLGHRERSEHRVPPQRPAKQRQAVRPRGRRTACPERHPGRIAVSSRVMASGADLVMAGHTAISTVPPKAPSASPLAPATCWALPRRQLQEGMNGWVGQISGARSPC